jgi:hypothetical protein
MIAELDALAAPLHATHIVIPAQAGIQGRALIVALHPRVRGGDG